MNLAKEKASERAIAVSYTHLGRCNTVGDIYPWWKGGCCISDERGYRGDEYTHYRCV